jgi:hypothetical protein
MMFQALIYRSLESSLDLVTIRTCEMGGGNAQIRLILGCLIGYQWYT